MASTSYHQDVNQLSRDDMNDYSIDFPESSFQLPQSHENGLNFYSFGNPSDGHSGANGVTNFDLPISPTMSVGDEMFYIGERQMHIDPATMWNDSEKLDNSANIDMAASLALPGISKGLFGMDGSSDRHFGQITPPSESEIHKESKRADSGVCPEVKAEPIGAGDGTKQNSSKVGKSTKTRTMSGGRRRQSKRSRSVSQIMDDDSSMNVDGDGEEGEGDVKREKYREKNRVAAAKCRAKKKDHVDLLEDTHRTQSVLNAALKQSEKSLRDELSFWRTQALQHTFCNCEAIQQYNLRKAQNLAAESILGNAVIHHFPSMKGSVSTVPSPTVDSCPTHTDRPQSVSVPANLSPMIDAANPQLRHQSYAEHANYATYQSVGRGSMSHGEVQHTPDAMERPRPLSSNEEQELKDFVNDLTE